MDKGNILLAAGGTGGHLFPAEALAHELKRRGYGIVLATDARADRFAGEFPADHKAVITSATLTAKRPVAILKMLWALWQGYRQSSALIGQTTPLAVVGFGGYPTIPPLSAAQAKGIPTIVHEQNAILGRANRWLGRKAKLVAVGFKQVGEKPVAPVIETGNPVRPVAQKAVGKAYPKRKSGDRLKLVVFGGSQGARFFSEIMVEGLGLLTQDERDRLEIVQQAREEDEAGLRRAYGEMGIGADISPFFRDMPGEIAKAHFVIARAGASSVTELALIGRPSLLVPLPGSLDGDQAANAISMAEAGGAFVVKQAELDGERLASILKSALTEPDRLAQMAQAAKSTGINDTAARLADCVECVISGGEIEKLKF